MEDIIHRSVHGLGPFWRWYIWSDFFYREHEKAAGNTSWYDWVNGTLRDKPGTERKGTERVPSVPFPERNGTGTQIRGTQRNGNADSGNAGTGSVPLRSLIFNNFFRHLYIIQKPFPGTLLLFPLQLVSQYVVQVHFAHVCSVLSFRTLVFPYFFQNSKKERVPVYPWP